MLSTARAGRTITLMSLGGKRMNKDGLKQVTAGFLKRVESIKEIADADAEIRPPDLDFCSRCHEHTDFELELGDGNVREEWISVCCGALPVEMG